MRSDVCQAMGRVRLAIRRLAKKYPYHAQILEQFRVSADPRVGTMGVLPCDNGVRLLVDAQFVLELPLPELVGVLLHEVHHVLFRHIFIGRDDFPDRRARIIAEEVTVNEFIREPLPAGAITLDDFPDLPPGESTKTRYERLANTDIQFFDASSQDATLASPEPLDNHDIWDAVEDWEDNVDDVFCDLLIPLVQYDQPVPEPFQEAFASISDVLAYHRLKNSKDGSLNWRRQLRRHIGRTLEHRPVYNRPNRRFIDAVGVVPGTSRRPAKPTVMAVIDTSGSMTADLLELVDAELRRLAGGAQVTVVECDMQIHEVYPYHPIEYVSGRGGTDLRPPFAKEFLRRHKPDLLVYFTDGDGPAPRQPPRCPVLWCIAPGGRSPCRWGRTIRMA